MNQISKVNFAKTAGFSLIEVTLAIGIAAVVIISIYGVTSSALQDAGDSLDNTAVGSIYEDIHGRVEGTILKEGLVTPQGSSEGATAFFYDKRGVFVDPTTPSSELTVETEPYFRADVNLIKTVNTEIDIANDKWAIRVELFWPIDETGIPFNEEPQTSITYFTAATTGLGWTEIDPNYEEKIEY